MAAALKGIEDSERLSRWLGDRVSGMRLPLQYQLVAAGGSNLSYRVTDASGRDWAMRRGPVAAKLKTAHDMRREWNVIRELSTRGQQVPVPEAVVYCDDEQLIGGEFYLMSFVHGRILRTRTDAADLDATRCRTAMNSLIEVQAAMHGLTVAGTALAALGREHDNYVARQLRRWNRQAEASAEGELPLLTELHEILQRRNPGDQAAPALVHGDYRFDNTVLGDDDRIAAVLDWELCTIGDPVADFFWSLLYWGRDGDALVLLPNPPTAHQHFPDREAVVDRYRQLTGYDLSARSYFAAFGYWKMACIVLGVYNRLRKGAGGGMKVSENLDAVKNIVDRYLDAAAEAIKKF